MQAVIMAGGMGTRLLGVTKNVLPKPMVEINGHPILWWQIKCLKENGIRDILLVVGHLGQAIIDYFGAGEAFGVNIRYFQETKPLGTAGSLYYLKTMLDTDNFLLVYGDVIFDVDLSRMEEFHITHHAVASMFVHPNTHPYDSDIVIMDDQQKVIGVSPKNEARGYWYKNLVNAGLYILSKQAISSIEPDTKTDLEKDVLLPLINARNNVYAYKSTEYIFDVGVEERLRVGEIDLQNGFVARRNLQNKQKCIFIDRDGTINKYKRLIYREGDLELEDCAVEAIKQINRAGYLGIVITNQPVVARGLCTIEDIVTTHNKLETILGENGAYLDDILFCPHHPDKGYPEENPLYKIECNCRKPRTGLIDICLEKYHIDPRASWFIGDTTLDIMTGKNAHLNTILVLTGEAGQDKKYSVEPDFISNNIKTAVQKIISLE